VHVCDGSHPDLAQQREHTMKTLSSFKNVAPGFLDRVITVRNKCDKMPAESDFQDDLPVSAKSGKGK
jgi:50S ribosomal subunit-associated GTPase HflX